MKIGEPTVPLPPSQPLGPNELHGCWLRCLDVHTSLMEVSIRWFSASKQIQRRKKGSNLMISHVVRLLPRKFGFNTPDMSESGDAYNFVC